MPSQRLSLQQKLLQKLSPQQIQVIKLLEIPTIQLEQRIKKELEENPVLEMVDDEPVDQSDESENITFEKTGAMEWPQEIWWGSPFKTNQSSSDNCTLYLDGDDNSWLTIYKEGNYVTVVGRWTEDLGETPETGLTIVSESGFLCEGTLYGTGGGV